MEAHNNVPSRVHFNFIFELASPFFSAGESADEIKRTWILINLISS